MGLEVIEQDSAVGGFSVDADEMFDEKTTKAMNIDARRRLEEKIEELRLQREMKEFDFDA